MAKGYWLMQTDVTDPDRHAEYLTINRPVFARYGARLLVRWGTHEVVEGVARSGQVVVEFPDYQSALSCYHDPDYEAAHKLRVGAADGDVVIVEGYDGPQPDHAAALPRVEAEPRNPPFQLQTPKESP